MTGEQDMKAMKQHNDEIKRLENGLRIKSDKIEELEIDKLNLQEQYGKDIAELQ